MFPSKHALPCHLKSFENSLGDMFVMVVKLLLRYLHHRAFADTWI